MHVLCLLLLVLGATSCGHSRASEEEKKSSEAVEVKLATASVRPMQVTVTASGVLSSVESAHAQVAPTITGRLLTVRVRQGDWVQRGQLLATVDNRVDRAQAENARAALTAARSDNETTVQQAHATLESEQQTLRKLRLGARPQEIAQADLAVRKETAARDQAEREAARQQVMFEHGVSSRQQMEEARTALKEANDTLRSAQQQASLMHAGTRPEEIRVQEARTRSAQDALTGAIRGGQAKVAQATATVAAAAAQERQGSLVAPLSGQVTRRFLDPGDITSPTTPLVEIDNGRSLMLVANLPVASASGLRPGLLAHAHSSVGGEIYEGHVRDVGKVDPQTGLLQVRIIIYAPRGLRLGEYATADIVVRTDQNAVVVPDSAILRQSKETTVFIVDDKGTAHERSVEVITSAGGVTEVSGVEVGTRVVQLGQYELEDGAQVKEAKP